MFGAVDSLDGDNGIDLGSGDAVDGFGFQNPKRGIIRIQEDAAFVCTNILVAIGATEETEDSEMRLRIFEGEALDDFSINPMLRLIDGNTGRNLINGMTTGPLDKDRGAIPFSYISSYRPGLGSNVKNKLFSEFTIPRAGAVRAEVYNMGIWNGENDYTMRAFVSLVGYKVFGA
jgi:hypothetical protein